MEPESRRRMPRGAFRTVCLAVIAVVLLAVALDQSVFAAALQRIVQSDVSRIPAVEINDAATVNGVTIRLVRAVFASDATMLDMTLQVEGTEVTKYTFAPITPDRLDVVGVNGDPKKFGSIRQGTPQVNALPLTVRIGPATSPPSDISISITVVGIYQVDDSLEWVQGPWTFTIPSDAITPDPVDVRVPVNRTVSSGPVTLTVLDAHISSRAVSVTYRMPGSDDGSVIPVASVISLVLPNGDIFAERGEGGIVDPLGDQVAVFPPLPEGVSTFSLRFGPFLAAEREPVNLDFPLPPGLDANAEDAFVPVGYKFNLAGDEMEVIGVHVRRGRISLEVANKAPKGTVMFVGPDTDDFVVRDDAGQNYAVLGGFIGFREAEDGAMLAGSSGIEFTGAISPESHELHVYLGSFGSVIYGPDELVIELAPSSDGS